MFFQNKNTKDREMACWEKHLAGYKDLCSDHQNPQWPLRQDGRSRQNPQKLSGRSSLMDAETGERKLEGERTHVAPPFQP